MMKVFRNPDILWREEDDATAGAYARLSKGEPVEDVGTSVLFSDGVMMSLNLLGTEIWKQCDGRTVEEMIAELTTRFDVEPSILKEDTLAFLDELEQKGFVRYENG